jgi:Immunity protein 26
MPSSAQGTVFAVPLPAGNFLCGRVMLDIHGCVKRRLFAAESPLPGLGKAILIEMYSLVVPAPMYVPSPLLIPGAFIEAEEVGKAWPVLGHNAVDPTVVEFPEALIGYHHPDGQAAFQCGEIHLPIRMPHYDLDRISVFTCIHSAFLWPYTCLRALGREKEVPADYKTATLSDKDLRFSPFREEVYQYLPFPMEEPYFEKQQRMGLHLERLYE